jgi:hypothetical protein
MRWPSQSPASDRSRTGRAVVDGVNWLRTAAAALLAVGGSGVIPTDT